MPIDVGKRQDYRRANRWSLVREEGFRNGKQSPSRREIGRCKAEAPRVRQDQADPRKPVARFRRINFGVRRLDAAFGGLPPSTRPSTEKALSSRRMTSSVETAALQTVSSTKL